MLLALSLPLGAAESRHGHAEAIDGDSLTLAGVEMRLHGIDAPEWQQSCARDGRENACGVAARDALAALLAVGPVTCRWEDRDTYGRAPATCFRGKENLNATLVTQGHALAYRRYSTTYVAEEDAARRARRGLWAGSFEAPAAWRARERRERAAAAPTECPVKGNVNRAGERIYHEHGTPGWRQVRIRPAQGDRCFDDTAQARAAGFRAPRGRARQ